MLLFKMWCKLSVCVCLCQSNMKAPTVLQSQNRAEKALFVLFSIDRTAPQ